MSARSQEQIFVCFGTVELAGDWNFLSSIILSFVHVALHASSTLLEEQSSESLVDVERQEPRGCKVWGRLRYFVCGGKCDNFSSVHLTSVQMDD